jgi:hypothetical protein
MLRTSLLVILCAALAGAAALGAVIASAGKASPKELWLTVSPAHARFDESVRLRGSVVPPLKAVRVVVERREAAGWRIVVRATTNADGRFAARLRAARGSVLRARVMGSQVRSPSTRLEVSPLVQVTASSAAAFAGAPVTVRVRPSAYAGRVRVTVLRQGWPVAKITGRAARGLLRLTAPAPGVGRFRAVVDALPTGEFAGATASAGFTSDARLLLIGSRGTDVLALRRRLAELRFHVPAPQPLFDERLFDSVVAFQKARGLERTGAVDLRTWSELAKAAVPRPRYRIPSPHIEIDKRRQILLVVRGGEVAAVLPISSGATGNTPEGSFRILWKAPATSTWLGSAILFRTMTFHGNFAIHGYHSVPTYPASHGCVRVPVWAADWLYNQSPVGERIYVYQ